MAQRNAGEGQAEASGAEADGPFVDCVICGRPVVRAEGRCLNCGEPVASSVGDKVPDPEPEPPVGDEKVEDPDGSGD